MRVVKYLLLIFLFITITAFPNSSIYVNSYNISKNRDIKFIELMWEKNDSIIPQKITVKYGVNSTTIEGIGILTGISGKKLTFGTKYKLIEYFRNKGWIEMKNYIRCYSGHSVFHFLFKKR